VDGQWVSRDIQYTTVRSASMIAIKPVTDVTVAADIVTWVDFVGLVHSAVSFLKLT